MNDKRADPIHAYHDAVAQLAADQSADRALKSAIAADKAAEEAEWTFETTQARRAGWNAAVKMALAKAKTGKLTAMQVAGIEKQAGFTLAILKAHIARHGL